MGILSRTSLWRASCAVLVVLLTLAEGGARGQWKIVAPNILPHNAMTAKGAMHYKDGIIWAGCNTLVFSPDSGKTWHQANFPTLDTFDAIEDINFADRRRGLVITWDSGVYYTNDGGQNWKVISRNPGCIVSFSRDSRKIFIGGWAGFQWSSDSGATWVDSFTNDENIAAFTEALNGTLFVSTALDNSSVIRNGYIAVSRDSGRTWQDEPSGYDCDSYSVTADSCDASHLVIANENYALTGDGKSKIYVSSDGGATWDVTFSHPIDYLVGSLVNSGNALYAGTTDDGVLRSTDKGQTWDHIGGPGCNFDCRQFAVINDNLIFSMDSFGNIWETDNGGGDPLGPLISELPSSYDLGTIYCDSLSHEFSFVSTACRASRLVGWQWREGDSSSIRISKFNPTSLIVTLRADKAGNKSAQYLLYFDNGSLDTLTLSGNVIKDPNTLMPSVSSLFSTDTILCDTITRTVSFSRTGCSPPAVLRYVILGPDSSSYSASNLNYNGLDVNFYGASLTIQDANLVLALSDGSFDTVILGGFVRVFHSPLGFLTSDIHTDTLGASVRVPITIHGLERSENVNLVLHYDGSVNYLGSFSPSGMKLDVSGSESPGRSLIQILAANNDSVAGYAEFNVFSDSGENAHATFDSLDILTAATPCEYSEPPSATSTIFPPKGCNIPILSKLIHLGEMPLLSVRPNPANGNVWITSSEDLGAATVTEYDVLGTALREVQCDFRNSVAVELRLPSAGGVYTLLVKSAMGTFPLRVVCAR